MRGIKDCQEVGLNNSFCYFKMLQCLLDVQYPAPPPSFFLTYNKWVLSVPLFKHYALQTNIYAFCGYNTFLFLSSFHDFFDILFLLYLYILCVDTYALIYFRPHLTSILICTFATYVFIDIICYFKMC